MPQSFFVLLFLRRFFLFTEEKKRQKGTYASTATPSSRSSRLSRGMSPR